MYSLSREWSLDWHPWFEERLGRDDVLQCPSECIKHPTSIQLGCQLQGVSLGLHEHIELFPSEIEMQR